MYLFLLISLCAIGFGIWQLTTPLDVLWLRRESVLLTRGLSPERNPQWEANERGKGWVAIAVGILFLLVVIGYKSTTRPAMSGIAIDGRQLTQAEWDACGHNIPTCLTQETIKRH